MDNTHLRHERTHTAIGRAVTEKLHGGHAISTRTGGSLANKINEALAKLDRVPLANRDEYWAAAVGGARHAADLLSQGRRAKAGKVLASARVLIQSAVFAA